MSEMARKEIKFNAEAMIMKWGDLIRMVGGYGNFKEIISRLRGLEMETKHMAEIAEHSQKHYPET